MKDNFVIGLIVGIILVFVYNVYEDNKNPVIPVPTHAVKVAPINTVAAPQVAPPVVPQVEPTWTPFFAPTPIPPTPVPPSLTPSPTIDSNPWDNITPEAGLATKVP